MDTFHVRMLRAWKLLEDKEAKRRLSAAAVAQMLKDRYGLELDASTVGKWVTYGVVPSLEKIAAFAKLAGVDPGWLAFGAESAAPAPGTTDGYYQTQPRKP